MKVFGELSDDLRDMGTHKYFEWRHEVWRWYDGNDDLPGMSHFRPVRYPFHKPISEIFLHYPEGRVDIPQRVLRKLVFGDNLIHVDIPGVIQLLLDEVLHPFYLFQVFSVLLWFYEVYITYSIAIILISAIGAIVSVVQTRSNLKNLKSLAEFECEVVRVFNGERMLFLFSLFIIIIIIIIIIIFLLLFKFIIIIIIIIILFLLLFKFILVFLILLLLFIDHLLLIVFIEWHVN